MGRVGFHMRMDQELHASVMDAADRLDMSMNEFICTVLGDFLDDDELYIIRLKVERLEGKEIVGYEIKVPPALTGLQDG